MHVYMCMRVCMCVHTRACMHVHATCEVIHNDVKNSNSLTSSPFFTAFVLIPLTSEPHPGSVTQYACRQKAVNVYNSHVINIALVRVNGHHKCWVQNVTRHCKNRTWFCASRLCCIQLT